MTLTTLIPQPLTPESFSDYGDVVDISSHQDIREINYGMTKRFHDLANLDLLENNGRPLFNYFQTRPVVLPFRVSVIERHPLSSQLFFPLDNQPFLVLVAKADHTPTPDNLKLFITNGFQGINYKKNIWHHYLMALKESSGFIVVDRGGKEKNFEEFFFDREIVIERVDA